MPQSSALVFVFVAGRLFIVCDWLMVVCDLLCLFRL